MQKHSFYLAKYLSKLGHQVTLFHCVGPRENLVSQEQVRQEMQLHDTDHLEAHCLKFPVAGILPGHYLKESYLYSSLIFDKLKKHLDDYDFIYAKGFSAWRLLAEKAKGLKCPPIGIKFHGYEMFQGAQSFKGKIAHLMLRGPVKFNHKHSDFVFSYGGKITNIIKKIGVADKSIIEIPTGIATSWIHERTSQGSADSPRRFLFIGRYERRKGIEELNEVLKMLINRDEKFFIDFIGPIPASNQIKDTRICYHGKIMDATKIQKIMDGADVLLTPSHSEGMPNVILEGMARGLAVIATNVGAVSLQVDKENGWILEKPEIALLYQSMIEAIKMEPARLFAKQQKSAQYIRDKFTWEEVAKLTEKKILALMAGHEKTNSHK